MTSHKSQQFTLLVGEHHSILFAYALRLAHIYSDAEELVQQCYLKLWQKRDKLLAVEAPKAYMMRCLHNLFIDNYHRQVRTKRTLEDLQNQPIELEATQLEPAQILLAHQVAEQMQHLSAEQQSILVLHDIEGYSASEIAQILEKPLGTVKSHIHRAREQLRRLCQNFLT